MMVIVQLFAADPECDRGDVGAGVGDRVVAIAPVVANTIDDAGGVHRNPRHLQRPDSRTDRPEQNQIQYQHQAGALPGVFRVNIALDPVVRYPMTVFVQSLLVFRLGAIQLRTLGQHFLDAVEHGAVRIFRSFALGVMLAVNRHPLLGDHARGQPQPESEKMAGNRVQVKAAVGLGAMQKNGYGGDGDMRQQQGNNDIAPPRQINQAIQDSKVQVKLLCNKAVILR